MHPEKDMRLHCGIGPNSYRVRIFMAEKGIDVPRVEVDITTGEHKTPEFLKLNSLGQIPVLELGDGTVITESVAICRYLEELHPTPAAVRRGCGRVAPRSRCGTAASSSRCSARSATSRSIRDALFKERLVQFPAFAETAARRPFPANGRGSTASSPTAAPSLPATSSPSPTSPARVAAWLGGFFGIRRFRPRSPTCSRWLGRVHAAPELECRLGAGNHESDTAAQMRKS